MRPIGCRFIRVLWAGGSLVSFLTASTLSQITDVVEGPEEANAPILMYRGSWEAGGGGD